MKDKSEFSRFACGLGLAFGLPWLFLVVLPYLKLSAIEPVAYSEADAVEGATAYPAKQIGGSVATGERLYDSLGCAYCHTQMVRPTYAGSDMWRGWGGRKEGGLARETRPEDYWGDTRAMLGYVRIGPDLSNIGWRSPDRAWHHQHLFSPRSLIRESVMPAYESLYEVSKIGGQPSANAIQLEGKFAPEEGFEVVPTSDAEALVDYLLSRKKDAPIPEAGMQGEPARPAVPCSRPSARRLEALNSMSTESHNDTNIDYSTGGASVLDVHDAERREYAEPQSGIEPISAGTLVLAAGIILLGAVYFGWHSEGFSMSTIYKNADYTPEAAPMVDGLQEEEDTGPWIDTWLAAGKKHYANCIACHQPTGTGAPGQFPPLVGVDYVSGGTERLGAILLHGINGPLTVNGAAYNQQMPAWAMLGDEKIAQVMTYIRTEFGGLAKEDAVVTTEMMNTAREKFSDRNTFWTEPELKQLSSDANLPGTEIDFLTGEPLGSDAAPEN